MDERKQILIVEDDVDLVEMLSAYFRVQGYSVKTASWGEDAVRMTQEVSPDLILLDIRLPDIDGFEVCRRIRQRRRTQGTPVIFLTEKRERGDRLTGLELGAVDYVTKPFDVQELRLRVRNVLRRSEFRPMVNPITGLPEGQIVRERLEKVLKTNDWGVILAGVNGLQQFRDQYGFIASDDVARAISLMLSKTVEEQEGEDQSFIGHADIAEFLIITKADRVNKLADKCKESLKPSIPYFYPAIDRETMTRKPPHERLDVNVVSFSSDTGAYQSFEDLRSAMMMV